MWKLARHVTAAGAAICLAGATAFAASKSGGGHPSFHAGGGGGVAHFNVGHVSHFNVGHVSHFNIGRHVSHYNLGHRYRGTRLGSRHINRINVGHAHVPATTLGAHAATTQLATSAAGQPTANRTDRHNYEDHRRLAGDPALHHFLDHDWWYHHHRHLGWVGPVFWPYAYGDFFYYVLWPYDYYYFDPFWAYGYDDLYAGIFSPYSYEPYVRGRGASARMTALKEGIAQACDNEAAEVTGWPIDQIQEAVQPTDQQKALLDDLGNAVIKASDAIKSQCPTNVSFTPTGRLADMQQRLQGMIAALDIVTPPLTKFYDSLSDEQKARFDQIGAPGGRENAQNKQATNAANPQAECGGNVIAWPADKIEHAVQPTDAQRTKLEALQAAADQAADIIRAACPSEPPATPPARLEAIGKRLRAMLQAVQTVRPALQDLYDSLSDDQKARFNMLGRQIVVSGQ